MTTKRILGFLLIILCNATVLSIADSKEVRDYYSPENVLKFADFLYEQEDYLRAAGEYQRYLFYQPREREIIRYRIALCYRFGGKTEQAIRSFETFLQDSPNSRLTSNVHYQIGVSYFLLEQYGKSAKYLDATSSRITDGRYHAEARQLIGLSYLMQNQWGEAEKIFNGLQKSDVLAVREKAAVYSKYAAQGAKLPTRSPFLAGFFSAIVPGTGRLYAGRFGDALTSLLTVGLTGWQAYDGFRRDGITSVKGWGFGTLSGIFYVGNIYGSVISARVYNHHAADEFLATLFIEFPY
jgi:TM2 domain-containing membrane protein YozV